MSDRINEKSSLAEAKIIADLVEKGYQVAMPMATHIPFDLIAIDKDFNLYKVQVKHRKITKGGVIVDLRRPNSRTPYSTDEVDIFAIYVTDTNECLYVKSHILENNRNGFKIRIEPESEFYCGGPVINKKEDFLTI
jgi:hypothetical protein